MPLRLDPVRGCARTCNHRASYTRGPSPNPPRRSTLAGPRSRTRLSEPGYVDPDDNAPECPQGLGRLLLLRGLFTRFIGVGASSFGKSIAKAPNRERLHAIHGMPSRTLLLRAFAAGQRQITTARSIPLLSPAVPWSMPQICPRRPALRGWYACQTLLGRSCNRRR
jgi:hypothetical protein